MSEDLLSNTLLVYSPIYSHQGSEFPYGCGASGHDETSVSLEWSPNWRELIAWEGAVRVD